MHNFAFLFPFSAENFIGICHLRKIENNRKPKRYQMNKVDKFYITV